MIINYDTSKWNWLPQYHYKGSIEIENTNTELGTIKDIDSLVYYLDLFEFGDEAVGYGYMQEAVINCARELGCIYTDIKELANDIRKYYI